MTILERLREISNESPTENETDLDLMERKLPRLLDIVECCVSMRDQDWDTDTDRLCRLLDALERKGP